MSDFMNLGPSLILLCLASWLLTGLVFCCHSTTSLELRAWFDWISSTGGTLKWAKVLISECVVRKRFYIHVWITKEVEMKQKQNVPAAESNPFVARDQNKTIAVFNTHNEFQPQFDASSHTRQGEKINK